ncbi:uncharacterized protein LOC122093943 [Macadamia integrifolia]|uniref:uncharacterized protein LOC122093943 n=1 Tax=Macadamia integrifolia TaxID=60698 RepID=UPI001C52A473|nr:uncharacterized protein LOC122093943 [Macadamia integrifolia]
MLAGFQARFRFPAAYCPLWLELKILCSQRFSLSQLLSKTRMGTQAPTKRPFCASCSKPARLCLCSRIKTPSLDNSIEVTILLHSQERKHPLNSTRIATLGLKNLTVVTVSDVHIEARFLIRLLEPCPRIVSASGIELALFTESEKRTALIDPNGERGAANDTNPSLSTSDLRVLEEHESAIQIDGKLLEKQTCIEMISTLPAVKEATSDTQAGAANGTKAATSKEESVVTATISKCGYTCSLTQLKTSQNDTEKPDFDQLLATQLGQDVIANGFVVKKLQKKQLDGINELEEYEEFEVTVPPGSALLFPTKKSIGVEAVDFEVKHLIVLDGTWGKAKRMYHENPWLKLLPHLKLDPSNMSLYSEVRHQPKAGCLSTIESIVSALKAFGDDREGLDELLDVFVSMVRDQRRCKDERLSKISHDES